jgi:hypothetical protein
VDDTHERQETPMHDPRPARPRRHNAAALAIAATLALATTACGNDSEDAYCDAWEGTVDAYTELRALDVAAVGTDGLRSAVEGLDSALQELAEATEDQAGDDVQRLRTSVEQLIETVLSPDLPVDRRDEVAVAVDDLRSAWDDVADSVRVECPDINLATS